MFSYCIQSLIFLIFDFHNILNHSTVLWIWVVSRFFLFHAVLRFCTCLPVSICKSSFRVWNNCGTAVPTLTYWVFQGIRSTRWQHRLVLTLLPITRTTNNYSRIRYLWDNCFLKLFLLVNLLNSPSIPHWSNYCNFKIIIDIWKGKIPFCS